MILFNKQKIYLMDENVKMSVGDIEKLGKCKIINSTDKYPKGTADDILTDESKKNGWIIVTKDIRMALRSLSDNVPVIYINDDYKTVSYLNARLYNRSKYIEMFEYLSERFGFT